METVIISGAGPVGCTAALLLRQSHPNLRIVLFEKRPDFTQSSLNEKIREKNCENCEEKKCEKCENKISETKNSGKSVNLALSHRGITALQACHMDAQVLAKSVPMRARALHHNDTMVLQEYDDVNYEKCIFSVGRNELNEILMDEIKRQATLHDPENTQTNDGSISVFFEENIVKIVDMDNQSVQIETNKHRTLTGRIVLGCDGAYSVTRELMSRMTLVDFSRQYVQTGYCELSIPSGLNGEFQIKPHEALHIWPKDEENMMMIALPNPDGSFTATLFAPFSTLKRVTENKQTFDSFLERFFPECFKYLDDFRGGAHPLFTANVSPWNARSAVLLLGDAAHTQVPFFGQGMNAGLEDAQRLVEALDECNGNWALAIANFEPKRRSCGHAITELSMENYEEMHTHSASLVFRLKRRMEGFLARITKGFSGFPLYYSVAFTSIPYDEILTRKRRNKIRDAKLNKLFVGLSVSFALVHVAQFMLYKSFAHHSRRHAENAALSV